MNLAASSLLIGAVALAGAANACDRPTTPGSLPDGNTAPREQMIAAFKSVSDYNQQMTEYLDCIKAEHETALEAKKQQGEQLKNAEQREYHERDLLTFGKEFATRHDAAYEELVAVVARFNKEKAVFNDRVKKEKEAGKGQ